MAEIEYKILKAGYCIQNEQCSIKNGANKPTKFHAMFVLIKHSKLGSILYDTGYSSHFYKASNYFPYSIYARITPVFIEEKESAKNQLAEWNIKPEEVNYIIISHFHADHIAGLKDFPNAKFICTEHCWNNINKKQGFTALKRGFLPDLIPSDFENRLLLLKEEKTSEKFSPFQNYYDIFGDESIIGIDLSGHACGQLGIIVNNVFFVADACWKSQSYRENIAPPLWTRILLGNNKQYLKKLQNLHEFYLKNPHIKIIPSHCNEYWSNND